MLVERTRQEIFIIIIHFVAVVSALVRLFYSADIWVTSQEDIAANEETLKQCKVI